MLNTFLNHIGHIGHIEMEGRGRANEKSYVPILRAG